MKMYVTGLISAMLALSGCAGSDALKTDVANAPAYDWVIDRDEWGIPTGKGETDADAAYALAIAHAEDDFESIQGVYFAANGKAGLLNGREGAGSDFLYHLFEVQTRVDTYYEQALSADVKALLEAYADGLNAYAMQHPKEVEKGIWPLSGKDVAQTYLLFSPLFYGVDSAVGGLAAGTLDPCSGDIAKSDHFRGSNAFAVAPKAAENGSTYLLMNPHNPWDGPLSWYEGRVHSEQGWRVAGGMLSGTPFPSGAVYTDAFAYAPTVNRPDLIDYFLLTTSDDRPNQYFLDGTWTDFRIEKIKLKVKWGPIAIPVSRTLKYSVHGPAFETPSGWVAMSYPDYHAPETALKMSEQYYQMGKSRSVIGFLEALEMRAVPSFNFVFADRAGDIGFIYNANLPNRAEGVSGVDCVRGDQSDLLWSGLLPLTANPRVLNPNSGWVFSANASPFYVSRDDDNPDKETYPINIGIDDRLTNRARRLSELLSDDAAPFSRSYLRQLKFDEAYSSQSAMAVFVRDTIQALENDPEFSEAVSLLSGWDLISSADSRASLFAHELFNAYHAASWWGGEVPELKDHTRSIIDSMKERYSQIDPVLGDVVRHMRGAIDLPLGGGDDTLRMIRSVDVGNGRRRANYGDGMTFLIEWTRDGEQFVHGFHQYGSALGRKESVHFDDQATPFVEKKWRNVPSPLPVASSDLETQ